MAKASAKAKPAKTTKKTSALRMANAKAAEKAAKRLRSATLDPGWAVAPFAVSAPPAPERKGAPIEIEDLYDFQLVGDPNISPDGGQVAVSVTHIDKQSNEYRAAIWRFPLDGEAPVRLTSGRWADGSPRWSPDGEWIAFTSKRETKAPQIWLLPTGGGEARQITDLDNGASDIEWAPDSRRIVFTSQVSPEKPDPENDVRVITSARYKFDGQGFLDDKMRQLWTVDALAETPEPAQLTSGPFNHGSPRWSPTGREIAFIANRDPEREMSSISDLWTIPATGGEPRRLTDGKGSFGSPAWSPDGTRIAIAGDREVQPRVQNARLFVIAAGGGEPAPVGTAFDRAIGDRSISGPTGNGDGPTIRWTPDGSRIDALVSDRGSTVVVRFDPVGDGATQLTGRDRHVAAFDHIDGGDGLVISVADPTTPFELRRITSDGETALSTINEAWTATRAVATPEEFWIDSGGETIQGWLLRPAGNSADGPAVPLILNVHGGPHAQFSPAFFHELQLYASRGFALVYINPRGSLGYREEFAQMVTGAWGEADAPDFLAAIEHVIGLGGIDPERIGVSGGS
nr:S9 family peptidase [Chloroflexia bacterium]